MAIPSLILQDINKSVRVVQIGAIPFPINPKPGSADVAFVAKVLLLLGQAAKDLLEPINDLFVDLLMRAAIYTNPTRLAEQHELARESTKWCHAAGAALTRWGRSSGQHSSQKESSH